MPFVAAQGINSQVYVGDHGLEIEFPKIFNIKLNETYQLHVHVFNVSNGRYMTDVSCLAHIYNISGSHIYESWMSKDTNGIDYNYSIKLNKLGDYSAIVSCNNSVQGGFSAWDFKVTAQGGSNGAASNVALYVFFIISLFFFLGFVFMPDFYKWFFFVLSFFFMVLGINVVALALQNDASSQNILNFYDSLGGAMYYALWVVGGLALILYIWGILASIATKQKLKQAEAVGRPIDWNKF